jgi:glycosyltransferase involved in cell wall biosynthesis
MKNTISITREAPQKNRCKELILFGSCTVDWGSKSITETYAKTLNADITVRLTKGFKQMRLLEILKMWAFLFQHRDANCTIICMHRAPTLIAGLFPLPRKGRWITIISSNASCPYVLSKVKRVINDWIYRIAFRRFDAVYSPFPPFCAYYNAQGAQVQLCRYPLPFPVEVIRERTESNTIRVLFIGAAYKRKGGELLLDFWAANPPPGASLTFVCPSPPQSEAKNVRYETNIIIGTDAHRDLLRSHDIMILPTFREPFGFVLLEAINFGLCTITTEVAGAADLVRESGGIVAADPASAITELARICSNPKEVEERKRVCREFVLKYDEEIRQSLTSMLQMKF